MAAMAVNKGAQGIIGYNENVAFHPDGSKYFSCFGTAVMFEREGRNDLLNDPARIKSALSRIPTANPVRANVIDEIGAEKDTVSLSSFAKKAQAEDIEKKAGEELSSGAKNRFSIPPKSRRR